MTTRSGRPATRLQLFYETRAVVIEVVGHIRRTISFSVTSAQSYNVRSCRTWLCAVRAFDGFTVRNLHAKPRYRGRVDAQIAKRKATLAKQAEVEALEKMGRHATPSVYTCLYLTMRFHIIGTILFQHCGDCVLNSVQIASYQIGIIGTNNFGRRTAPQV